jgi:tripartite-type tricarboxylate transporter receptor subunit TctC
MAQRLPQTPGTPAIAEQVPGYEAYTWNAVFAPQGTPQAVINRLQSGLQATVDDAGLQKKAYDMGLVLDKQPRPQALATFLKQELDKWGKVARAAHMSAN